MIFVINSDSNNSDIRWPSPLNPWGASPHYATNPVYQTFLVQHLQTITHMNFIFSCTLVQAEDMRINIIIKMFEKKCVSVPVLLLVALNFFITWLSVFIILTNTNQFKNTFPCHLLTLGQTIFWCSYFYVYKPQPVA